jgi:hypothetical protein
MAFCNSSGNKNGKAKSSDILTKKKTLISTVNKRNMQTLENSIYKKFRHCRQKSDKMEIQFIQNSNLYVCKQMKPI